MNDVLITDALGHMDLQEQKEFAESLVQNSAVPTFVVNPQHQVLIWNKACEEFTGIKAETMLGRDEQWKAFYDHKRPLLADIIIDGTWEQTPEYYTTFCKSAFIPEGLQAEGWYPNLNGFDRYIFFNAAPIRNSKGKLLAVVETLEDITERKRYEEQLEYQANHDELTKLPNRNLLSDRIQQALLLSNRKQRQVAVMFIDLDNFKLVNDTLGHDAGDALLRAAAVRFNGCVRAGDTVARQGGDEFVVVIPELPSPDVAAQIADKLQQTMAQPLRIDEHELVITCSIGISMFPRDGEDLQTLMKHADIAMYKAKEMGRNNFQFFTREMNARSLVRMTMEKHLRRALERSEFFLNYQPQVSLRTGRIAGMESLVRWKSPEMGTVFPGSFIPLAEETGLIEPIGEWILRTACAQNKAWQDAGLPALTVAVNLSAHQFRVANFSNLVSRILHETGLDPKFLELEITESVVMQNTARVTRILNDLKAMGIQLAMDDFGTGYSSLSYLKRFPFDRLKIDQSFVVDITTDPESAAIAKTVIAMAKSLRLKVIAEGVETESQLNYLRSLNCDEIQGYYFSRPLDPEEFARRLRDGARLEFKEEDECPAKTILLVDDDENVLSSLQRMLCLEGYKVLVAGSAMEGFEQLANNSVSLVISDQRMPGMSGSEFLSRVKTLYPSVMRIILSGNADLTTVTEAINQGAIYKFLSKPWDDSLLLARIEEVFNELHHV